MSYYNKKIGKGKQGVNFLRTVVTDNDCYFNEISQENDVGIDAIIEVTENAVNTGKCIAVQIKTGPSYFSDNECHIPIGNHFDYWRKYSLPVYGVVCDYERKKAYWVNISSYIQTFSQQISIGEMKSITFPKMEMNCMDTNSFSSIFLPYVQNRLPEITYETAERWITSEHRSEREVAWAVMLREYPDEITTWDACIKALEVENDTELLRQIVYYLSYVPRHPDLCGDLPFSELSRTYAKNKVSELSKNIVCRLLNLIDEDGIARGTIGQCVEAIVSFNIRAEEILCSIIEDEVPESLYAYYILCYVSPTAALNIASERLELLQSIGVETDLIEYLKEAECFDFYG